MVRAVLLFGAETLVLSSAMFDNIKGVQVGCMQQVTGMKARKLGSLTWKNEGQDRLINAKGTKPMR